MFNRILPFDCSTWIYRRSIFFFICPFRHRRITFKDGYRDYFIFLCSVLAFYTRDYFRSIVSAQFLVILLGLAILILFIFPYFFIGKFIGDINCEKLPMSECYNLSTEQFILASVTAFIFSFALTGVLFALAHSLYRIISKSSSLR